MIIRGFSLPYFLLFLLNKESKNVCTYVVLTPINLLLRSVRNPSPSTRKGTVVGGHLAVVFDRGLPIEKPRLFVEMMEFPPTLHVERSHVLQPSSETRET